MATRGTPKVGLSDIATLAYVTGQLSLVAYTNAADSLGPNTVAGDLTQPTAANGYAPITLNGTWSSIDGVTTYTHNVSDPVLGAKPIWTATGTWSATVTGIAMLRGGVIRHFKDNAVPFVAAAGKKLAVDITNLVGP